MCPVLCALLIQIQIQMMTQMKRVHSCTPVWMGDLVGTEKYTSGVELKVRSLDFFRSVFHMSMSQLVLNQLVALVLKSWP